MFVFILPRHQDAHASCALFIFYFLLYLLKCLNAYNDIVIIILLTPRYTQLSKYAMIAAHKVGAARELIKKGKE